jgi:hypothetical protein
MSTKKNGNGGTGASANGFDAQVTELATLVTNALALANQMGLVALSAEERAHSMGRLRANEPEAMTSIFDAMDAFPNTFEPLAAKDGGTDPNLVETEPARADLARAEQLAPIAKDLAKLHTLVIDDVMASGQAAKEVSVPAYAIGKAGAAANPQLASKMATAITFYGAPARLRAHRAALAASAAQPPAAPAPPGPAQPAKS